MGKVGRWWGGGSGVKENVLQGLLFGLEVAGGGGEAVFFAREKNQFRL